MAVDFDLPALDTKPLSEAGVWMHVKDVFGAPLAFRETDVKLKLRGPDSKAYQKAYRDLYQSQLKAAENKVEFDVEQASARVFASLTVDWTGFFTTDGTAVPFSEDVAFDAYVKMPALLQQAQAFADARANFIRPPSAA